METLPAGALDVLDELGDELVAEVRPEVPRVQLHVPLQHDVEEHLAPLPSAAAGGEASCEATESVLIILNEPGLMLLFPATRE